MEYRYVYNGAASAYYYDAASSSAAAFPPAEFGTDPSGGLAPLDVVFDYVPNEGVHPAPASVPAGTFGTPPPPLRSMPAVQVVVPGAAGYRGHAARNAAAVAAAAAEGPMRTDRIAFRMRSDEEVLDDGYKWRKYGKKAVKNSPNPRSYYRCSTEGCSVKKRVERDRDDASYVVTTYEGVHNHMSPGTVYYASQSQDAASGRFFVSEMQHLGP